MLGAQSVQCLLFVLAGRCPFQADGILLRALVDKVFDLVERSFGLQVQAEQAIRMTVIVAFGGRLMLRLPEDGVDHVQEYGAVFAAVERYENLVGGRITAKRFADDLFYDRKLKLSIKCDTRK